MSKKKKSTYKRTCIISDVAINSIVRFSKRSDFYKVTSIDDGIVFLEEVAPNPQLSFVSPLCLVQIVEGF